MQDPHRSFIKVHSCFSELNHKIVQLQISISDGEKMRILDLKRPRSQGMLQQSTIIQEAFHET